MNDWNLSKFPLVSKKNNNQTIIDIKGIKLGSENFIVMAGPCSIESLAKLKKTAEECKKAKALILRGGAFKPRTSPYSFQGLETEGLKIIHEVGKSLNMPIISEIPDQIYLNEFCKYADIIQVGARNMQNFSLLKALGKANKPILLKRGFAATIEEWLLSAEYIMKYGNPSVILCERGIRSFDPYMKNILDLGAVMAAKELTHLPVIVDPSHGAGNYKFVSGLAKASLACGADGLLIEVHHEPEKALSDGNQSLKPEKFQELMENLQEIAPFFKKKVD